MTAINFFVYLAEIVIGATIISAVMKKFNQPNLFAYIVAGIILGPLVLGSIDLSFLNLPFELGIKEISPEMSLLAELGTAFLLFSIGVETSIAKLFRIGKPLIAGTIIQVLLVIWATIVLTTITGFLNLSQAIFVGTIIAFSSTMIVIKLLSDKKETNTLNGKVIIAVTLIQDFLILFFIPLLSNINSIGDLSYVGVVIGKGLLIVIIGVILNRLIFKKLFDIASKEQELFFLASISTAFLFIGLGYLLQIPINIAGFIGGVTLSTLTYNTSIFSKVRALRDFFMVIFFVTLGVQLNFSLGALPVGLVVLILFIVFIVKPITTFLVTVFSGYGGKIGVDSALSLVQISEFGFYLAALGVTVKDGFGNSIISPELFSFMVAITAISMILTPYFTNLSDVIWGVIQKKRDKFPKLLNHSFFARRLIELQKVVGKKEFDNHYIIVGGSVTGRELARKLIKDKKQVIIIDANPDVVLEGQKSNLPFVYGSYDDTTAFEKADIDSAKLVIITLKTIKDSKLFLEQAKAASKTVPVYVVANHFDDAIDLYNEGADFVAMPSIMGANELFDTIRLNGTKVNRAVYEKAKTERMKYIKEQLAEERKYNTRLIPKDGKD